MQNHIIDPTYFYDCIEEFSFDYTIYVVIDKDINAEGYEVCKYQKNTIRGSLQSNGISLTQSKSGNTKSKSYNFYCKSLYRINVGDIIEYKNTFYLCKEINNDFDEFGVRGAILSMINLSDYNDLKDYINYLKGELLV